MSDLPHKVRAINKACREQRGHNVYITFDGGWPDGIRVERVINARTCLGSLQVKLLYSGDWIDVPQAARIYEA